MSINNIYYDKAAMGLSLLCTLHCLALPLFSFLLPTVSSLSLEDEGFHFLMLMMVLPISSFALLMGFKNHKNSKVLVMGVLGLIILSIAVMSGHDLVGELGEKILTLLGSGLICYSHYLNYKNCQPEDNCCCHNEVSAYDSGGEN